MSFFDDPKQFSVVCLRLHRIGESWRQIAKTFGFSKSQFHRMVPGIKCMGVATLAYEWLSQAGQRPTENPRKTAIPPSAGVPFGTPAAP